MSEIVIASPAWCPACGAIIDDSVGWWPPDETPPSQTALLVALRDEDGEIYQDLADYYPSTQTWRLVGDLTGGQPCEPLAWRYPPDLPEWLR